MDDGEDGNWPGARLERTKARRIASRNDERPKAVSQRERADD
ncbi:hypothetical protein [Natronorubrum sulfidifaciens]|nr:hypothetical protein [Natronorubrum sulfidifaciens]